MRIVLVTLFFFNIVVITTVIEIVETFEILDGRLGKRSVERVRYVMNNITLDHCEIWSHFTRTLYFHSPSARENTVATRDYISSYFTLTRVISLVYENLDLD